MRNLGQGPSPSGARSRSPVTRQIARAGGPYRRDYGRSHGVGLAEGVIAATAVAVDAVLMTLNVRRYPMFDALEPAYRK